MSTKLIAGIIIVAVIVVGAIYLLGRNSGSSPMSSQTQMQTSPTSTVPVSGNSVTIQNFAFAPATLMVKVGDKVTWTNQDSVGHSATADDGSWDTGLLSQGQSGSVTFSKTGTFTYHCSIHPTMHGTVIVQ